MTTDTQRQYSIPEKLQLQGNTYPVINWNDIRTRGLLYKANALVFNPAGLMLFVDVESGVSPGAMEGDFTPPGVVSAEEPVGVVFTIEAIMPGGKPVSHVNLNRDLPAGTKLYAEPQGSKRVRGLVEALLVIAGTHHHAPSAGSYFSTVAKAALAADQRYWDQ